MELMLWKYFVAIMFQKWLKMISKGENAIEKYKVMFKDNLRMKYLIQKKQRKNMQCT